MAEVGTTKVFGNDEVIVWELFPPGVVHGRHTHELPYVLYVFEGSSVRALGPDGEEAARADVPTGRVMEFRVEDGEFVTGSGDDEMRVPATHSLENVGESDYKEILIEFK